MRGTPRHLAVVFLAVLSGGLTPSACFAWTPESHRVIAASAARLAPPDLHRQITRNRDAFLLGAVEPSRSAAPGDHFKNPDGSGQLDEMIALAVEHAIGSIRSLRPFNEVAYRLGVVAHFVAAANDPLATAESDPQEARYREDFRRYLESTEGRVQVTFYGFRDSFDGRRDLPRLVDETLARGRELYPLVGREYQRIGYRSGAGTFSDRSTAFGVAALAYSHAVSDIAEVLRYIWLTAGGIDTRRKLPLRGREVVVLSLDPAVRQRGRPSSLVR